MDRTEYHHDPNAPKANSLIPASNLLVVDSNGTILLQRRRDTRAVSAPRRRQHIGETTSGGER
jgi:hypothetical protein